ncbi:GH25 family lysozyme [Bacillus sp. SCS-151]|uniref:GH25 family lysozyme n=1 Tax=Nanhaiella sioensis TaxID=3115293 RepID=UPI00397E333C
MQQRNPANNVKGIDVSHWQGNIDWNKVKSDNIEFAYIKASEGTTFVDSNLENNYNNAKQAGIKVGFYHFGTPSQSPLDEASWFLNVTSNYHNDLPHVLDIEQNNQLSKAQITQYCEQWLSSIEERSNYQPILYTYSSFAKSYLESTLGKWPLWIAQYEVEKPNDNEIWDSWAIFQYTDSGTINGITGNVDMNEMNKEFFYMVTSGKSESELINKCKYTLPTETLEHGDRGENVMKIQKILADLNFYPNKNAPQHGIDGVYGLKTKDMVQRFQKVYLPYEVDGIYGANTREKIASLLKERGCEVL